MPRLYLPSARFTALTGFVITAVILSTSNARGAGETAPSFSLDGTLYDSPSGSSTLREPATIRVQILNSAKTCVLYDERQNVDTTLSDGAFSIQVGSLIGSARRTPTVDPGNSMNTVYQNAAPILGVSACSYTPAPGDLRYVRVLVTPSSSGITDTLSPDLALGSVPSALVADSLQGVPRTGFLQLGAGALSQSNAENIFSSVNYSILTGLLAGGATTSAGGLTLNAGTGGSGGIDFNVNGSTKAGIANNGNFSVDAGSFFVEASTNRVGIGTSAPGASLDLGSMSDAVILPNGTTLQRPSPAAAGMLRFNSTTSKLEFHNGTSWADLGADISNITAGGDLSGTYPNPSVAKIRGQAISADAISDGQMLRFDGTNYTPAFVAMSDLRSRTTGAAALTSSCTSAQTLTWDSVADTLYCTAISGLNASVISAGTVDAAHLPPSASAWSVTASDAYRSGGSVAIGTSVPLSPLDIRGLNAGGVLSLRNTSASGWSSAELYDSAGTNRGATGWGNSGATSFASAAYLKTTGADPVVLATNDLDRLHVSANGNVGIGTTNPTQKLDVNGDAFLRGNLFVAGNLSSTNLQGTYGIGSSGGTVNYWGRMVRVEIASQYQFYSGQFAVNTRGGVNAHLMLNVRQDSPMGAAPVVSVRLDNAGPALNNSDVVAVTTVNSGASTVVELYLRTQGDYEVLSYQPFASNANVAALDYAPPANLIAALPAGAQTISVTGQAFWNPGDAASTITYAGKVGIGSTNPGQALTVAGTIESTSGGVKFPDGITQARAAATVLSANVGLAQVPAASTQYTVFSGVGFDASEYKRSIPLPTVGTMKNFYITIFTAQPASGSLTCTFRKNFVATALVVVIPANSPLGTYGDLVHSVAMGAGDLISVECVNAASTASAQVLGMSALLQ